jgi:hypothetical protein
MWPSRPRAVRCLGHRSHRKRASAPSLFPRYRARILLGMVAGPAIGLFFDQDGNFLFFATSVTNAPSLTNQLSATAIPFFAGFSIEILFVILDRLIRIIQDFAGADSHSLATSKWCERRGRTDTSGVSGWRGD